MQQIMMYQRLWEFVKSEKYFNRITNSGGSFSTANV